MVLLYLFGLLPINHEEIILDYRFLRLGDLGEGFFGQLLSDLFWGFRMEAANTANALIRVAVLQKNS